MYRTNKDYFLRIFSLEGITYNIMIACSFDVRGRRQFNNAQLWSSPTALGSRAFFITATNPAHLSIDRLEAKDEGIYRCMVDFKNTPTQNQKMNLTVIGKFFIVREKKLISLNSLICSYLQDIFWFVNRIDVVTVLRHVSLVSL